MAIVGSGVGRELECVTRTKICVPMFIFAVDACYSVVYIFK